MSQPEPTIFIVDDDEAVRVALSRAMRIRGIASLAFSSADDFLNHYKPEMTGCLLLDQGMPKMTGLELQDLLVQRGDGLPIIFMTGHGGAANSAQAMGNGAIAFLEKPCKQDVLFDLINGVLGHGAGLGT